MNIHKRNQCSKSPFNKCPYVKLGEISFIKYLLYRNLSYCLILKFGLVDSESDVSLSVVSVKFIILRIYRSSVHSENHNL